MVLAIGNSSLVVVVASWHGVSHMGACQANANGNLIAVVRVVGARCAKHAAPILMAHAW